MDDYDYDDEQCMYHTCIDELVEEINRLVRIYYNNGNGYLKPWLQDGPRFDTNYLDKIEEYSSVIPKQEIPMIKKKGINLEKSILRWLDAKPDIPIGDLQYKIEQYIRKQFKEEDIKELFDSCSC